MEDEQQDLLEDLDEIVNMVQIQRRASSKVTFSDEVEFLDVPKWYDPVPQPCLLIGPIGSKDYSIVPPDHDPWTGLSREQLLVEHGRSRLQASPNLRSHILRRVLLEGAAWEVQTTDVLHALVSKKKFKKKRVGVRAAKAAERLLNPSAVLVGDAATSFRALAAMAARARGSNEERSGGRQGSQSEGLDRPLRYHAKRARRLRHTRAVVKMPTA